jgi:hypothetical protein
LFPIFADYVVGLVQALGHRCVDSIVYRVTVGIVVIRPLLVTIHLLAGK